VSFWGVVQSQPAQEPRALWHMTYQGFTTYAPKEKITRITRGKKRTASRWLFPRYIFVWMDAWHALFSTIGLTRVLMNGEEPARIPNGWVDYMRSQERNGLIVLPKHRFFLGQRVTVGGGLFVGAKGLYQGMTNRDREIVLLEALGARVELAPGLLR